MIGLTILSVGVFAQTVEEAGAKYNEGNGAFNSKDYAGAVTAYTQALDIATQAGPDAEELKGKIEKQLTTSYLKQGVSIYKKDMDGAIATLEKGLAFETEIDDAKSVKKFKSTIAQLRTKKGDQLRADGSADAALAEYAIALEMKPNYPKAYYGEGMVYKETGELDMMMEKMDLAVKYSGDNEKLAKTVKAAKANAANALLVKAVEEFNAQNFEDASKYIGLSTNYAPFSEGTMEIFNQIADQAKDVPEMTDAITNAKSAL